MEQVRLPLPLSFFLRSEVFAVLNADEIARGLSPFDPNAAAIKAGRLLLREISECVEHRVSFGLESTLSGKTYVKLPQKAKATGYQVHLHYLWLPNVGLAISRVRQRVKACGHHVPTLDIRRRFEKSLRNLINDYAPLADRWAVWDNQCNPPPLLADSRTCQPDILNAKLIRS